MMTMRNLLLMGCLLTAASLTGAEEPPAITRTGWLAECPSSPRPDALAGKSAFLGAIFAAVAPKLIDGAIDSAAAALKAAGEAKSVSTTGKVHVNFYRVSQMADLIVDPKVGCLVVVRGTFATGPSGTGLAWADASPTLKGLQRVDFRFESEMRALSGLKSFQLVPVYAELSRVQESSWFEFAKKPKRDYSVSVSLQVPGAASPFGSASFTLPALTPGDRIKADDWRLAQTASEPLPFPAAPADVEAARAKREKTLAPLLLAMGILKPADAAGTKRPSLYRDPVVKDAVDKHCSALRQYNRQTEEAFRKDDSHCAELALHATRAAVELALDSAERSKESLAWAKEVCAPPADGVSDDLTKSCGKYKVDLALNTATYSLFTTSATLVETREGSKFAAYLATALGAAKSDISKELVNRMVPATKDAAADEKEARLARRGLALADLGVQKAEQALAEGLAADAPKLSEVTAARIDLVNAKIAANDAYRKAGEPVPYPELD